MFLDASELKRVKAKLKGIKYKICLRKPLYINIIKIASQFYIKNGYTKKPPLR